MFYVDRGSAIKSEKQFNTLRVDVLLWHAVFSFPHSLIQNENLKLNTFQKQTTDVI